MRVLDWDRIVGCGLCCIRGSATLHGRNSIQLGLFLLIATPVASVAFSIVAFALERDRMYVVITPIVLAVLLFSLAGGHL